MTRNILIDASTIAITAACLLSLSIFDSTYCFIISNSDIIESNPFYNTK
jgi:histidyl-tRNA synthetase